LKKKQPASLQEGAETQNKRKRKKPSALGEKGNEASEGEGGNLRELGKMGTDARKSRRQKKGLPKDGGQRNQNAEGEGKRRVKGEGDRTNVRGSLLLS